MVFVEVETGFSKEGPDPGQVMLLLLLVFAPGAHTSSPELFIILQLIGRFIVMLTLYGPTPPDGFTVIVAD